MGEEEIFLGKWIAMLHRCRKSYVNRRLSSYGLSGVHFMLLLALSSHDGVSQEAMAARLKMEKTAIAKSVKKLEQSGYIARERSEADGRAYRVFLTPEGLALIPLIRRTVREWEDEVTVGMPPEDRRALDRALHAMADRANELLG